MTTAIRHSHPHKTFPWPRPVTVQWYVASAGAPAEPGAVRYTTTTRLIERLEARVADRRRDAQRAGSLPFQATAERPALLVFLDEPMELLADEKARGVVLDALLSTYITGVYLALRLTRTDRADLAQSDDWGADLVEVLSRHDVGYPAYGNW